MGKNGNLLFLHRLNNGRNLESFNNIRMYKLKNHKLSEKTPTEICYETTNLKKEEFQEVLLYFRFKIPV